MQDGLNLVQELNELFFAKGIEDKGECFLMVTEGHSFRIDHTDPSGTGNIGGNTITVFESEEGFSEDIEDVYERNEITYLEAVKKQIIRNLQDYIDLLTKHHHMLELRYNN